MFPYAAVVVVAAAAAAATADVAVFSVEKNCGLSGNVHRPESICLHIAYKQRKQKRSIDKL